MALKNPPIQDITLEEDGRFRDTWIKWFRNLKDFVNAIDTRVTTLEGSLLSVDNDALIAQAIAEIESTYGDTVSVASKEKSLLKFGENPSVSTSRATIWYTGQDQANETYVADNTNSIDTISSSSGSDTEVVRVEGHTETGDNKTFVVQTATLDGQNKVTLGTPLNRVTRVAHNDESSTDLVGEIYVYEDTTISGGKPTDTTKIHLTIPAGQNQSQKASTSLSSQDYWIVTRISAGNKNKTGTNSTDVRLEVRRQGGVFKPVSKPLIFVTGTEDDKSFLPYIIIPKNADVRLTAVSSASGQDIVGDIDGFLAIVT